jgi:hypothetical protein
MFFLAITLIIALEVLANVIYPENKYIYIQIEKKEIKLSFIIKIILIENLKN